MIGRIIKTIVKKFYIIFILLLVAILVLFLLHISKTGKSKYILASSINNFTDSIFNYLDIDKKYDFENNFRVTSTFDANITSEEYLEKSYYEPDYYKKYHLIDNLSKLESSYKLIQNKDKERLLLEFNNKIGNEDILSGKYYVDNSTKYIKIDKLNDNFVNEGNNRYFENITRDYSTKENINYLYKTISNAIETAILEKEINTSEQVITINKEKVKTKELSLKITDEYIKVLLQRVLIELKKDKKASLILESIIPDFKNYKINEDKVYLENNESYTVNIYVRRFFHIPVKYEIIHHKNDKEESYVIEGRSDKGLIYYYDNNELKYIANFETSPKMIEVVVNNANNEMAGFIKLEKSQNSFSINASLNLENEVIDFSLSRIFKNYKKNVSYTKESNVNMKIMKNDIITLNGNINLISEIDKIDKIDEDIDDAILRLSLDDNTKEKYDNIYEELKNRLQS